MLPNSRMDPNFLTEMHLQRNDVEMALFHAYNRYWEANEREKEALKVQSAATSPKPLPVSRPSRRAGRPATATPYAYSAYRPPTKPECSEQLPGEPRHSRTTHGDTAQGDTMMTNKRIDHRRCRFIGTSLALRLIDDNDIVIFDNLHRNAMENSLVGHPRLTFIEGDVLDEQALLKAAQGCDVVIHMASIAGVDTVMKNPCSR